MPTFDGISDADWDMLLDRIADIVNVHEYANEHALDHADTTLLSGILMRYLRQLEDKYGRLASLVETEADYTWDRRGELMLHKEAYVAAIEQGDDYYLTAASKSLADLYLRGYDLTQDSDEETEAPVDLERGRFWLEKLEGHMKKSSDDFDHQDYAELKQKLDSLSSS